MAATVIKAHQIRLHPKPEQEAYLRRAAGPRRFVYNHGLAEWQSLCQLLCGALQVSKVEEEGQEPGILLSRQ